MSHLSIWFKASETLLGIETIKESPKKAGIEKIQSLWNPFRDWNTEQV